MSIPPPDASIVIPSYRHAAYVEAAVRSALACDRRGAGGPAVEVVVVDDGSDDGSLVILRRLEHTIGDPTRLRVAAQENAGAHVAITRGLDAARGEILFILDSDDLFEPERVATLLACFDDPRTMLAASWLCIVDADDAELGVKHAWRDLPPWPRPRPGPHVDDLDDPELSLLASNWVATTSNLALRRSLLERLRFQPLRYAHDWAFLLEACRHGRLAAVEEPLVRYRVHESNTLRETDRAEAGGRALMHFEILWLLARHADETVRRVADRLDRPLDTLWRRVWRSLPRFGAESLLVELLALRGDRPSVPMAYDALLDPEHPLRRQALRKLAEAA
ncbi:MAG: glycosyltransferase family A protein [Acidobacteriota bacterium]